MKFIASDNVGGEKRLVNRINFACNRHNLRPLSLLMQAEMQIPKRHDLQFLDAPGTDFFRNSFTRTLRDGCACGNYNSSACTRASGGMRQFVRRSVGAPTAHACAGNGSHHSEDISAGRSRPPGEFSRARVGASARSSRRCPPHKEPLRFDARGPLARADLVRGEGNTRTGAHPASRSARILSQGTERLWPQHGPGGHQRDLGTDSAGTRSFGAYVPANSPSRARGRTYGRLELAAELLRLLDGAVRRLAAALRSLRRVRCAIWRKAGLLRSAPARLILREVPAAGNEAAALRSAEPC